MESKAAKWFCSWVIAVYKYSNVYKLVQPKREKVANIEILLKEVQRSLEEKQKQLSVSEESLEQFRQVFKASNEKKIQLENKSNDWITELTRAGETWYSILSEISQKKCWRVWMVRKMLGTIRQKNSTD